MSSFLQEGTNKTILSRLIYLDRYRNEGTRTYSRHATKSEALPRFRPTHPEPTFSLPVFQLSPADVNLYLANPSKHLKDRFLSTSSVHFCIHPQVLSQLPHDTYVEKTIKNSTQHFHWEVSPSASTRTLYCLENPPHSLKVHFPFQVSRYTRKMREEVIEQAINVSMELEEGIHRFGSDFGFLREVIGVSLRNKGPADDRGENWGFLVRDLEPFPKISKPLSLIPGFALYGQDVFEPQLPSLLFDLAGNRALKHFVLDQIMIPIIHHWIDCFLLFGYLMEPHGQNTLLEVDDRGDINRIIHRDLSVGIDIRRRREIGLTNENLNSYNLMENHAFHSITYDCFMGHHFFDRLVDLCQRADPGLNPKDFHGPCKEEFQSRFPQHAEVFPKHIWYFSEQRDQFGKPLYKNTGEKPVWRP